MRSALATKFSDGKLTVVDGLDSLSGKTKDLREALDTLGVEKTSLIVANVNSDTREHDRNLYLSARNLDGVELVSGSEVHPYHLLRYDRAIFSRPAIEQLQETLKKAVSKRQKAEVA